MVLFASDFDQSKYLKAADLGEIGSEKRFKIKAVTKEIDVGEKQETKACVWFTNSDQRAGSQQDQPADSARRLRRRHGRLGRQDHRHLSDHGRLPRQDGPRLAGADSAAEGRPTRRRRRLRNRRQSRRSMKKLDGFDEPEQLDDDISDVR